MISHCLPLTACWAPCAAKMMFTSYQRLAFSCILEPLDKDIHIIQEVWKDTSVHTLQVFDFIFDPKQDFARLAADIKPSSSGLVPVTSTDLATDGYTFGINATSCASSQWVPLKPSTTYFVVFAVADRFAMTPAGAQNKGVIGATV